MSTQIRGRTAAERELVIRPPGRWSGPRLSELFEYNDLLYFLTKRELQIRYKQSVIGVGWAIIQPLVLAFVFALFFGRLVEIGSEGLPYPLFAFSGLVAWLFFAQSVTRGAASLVSDADLISKVYFPRAVIPISHVLSLIVDLTIGLVVAALMAFLYEVTLHFSTLPLVAPFILIAVVSASGFGLLLAALNVRYRDISLVVPMLVQIGLFISPIVYPASLVGGAWQYVYALNPMVSVVEGVRWALYGTPAPDPIAVGISATVAAVSLIAGYVYFERTERFFADVI